MPDTPNLKQQFIDAFRATPDGISEFLTAPVPTLETITSPADVDAAIIAQGKLAANLNLILKTFEGLTPIELLLRIGSHSPVAEIAALAGWQYINASSAQQDFSITAPTAGSTYQPGNLRLSCSAGNGQIKQVAVEIEGQSPIALESSDDGLSFYGYARFEAEETGEFTATFSALFSDDSTQTASVSFTIDAEAEEAELAEGEDLWSLELAHDGFKASLSGVYNVSVGEDGVTASIDKDVLTTIGGYAQKVVDTGDALLSKVGGNIAKYSDAVVGFIEGLTGSRGLSITLDDDLLLDIGDLVSAEETYYSAATAKYWELNQHPSGGYTSCPESLSGATQAMNDKYGPGSVSY